MIYHTHETPTTAKHPIASFVDVERTFALPTNLSLVLVLSILYQGRIIHPSDSSLLPYLGAVIVRLVLAHPKQLLALPVLTPPPMKLIGYRVMIHIIAWTFVL